MAYFKEIERVTIKETEYIVGRMSGDVVVCYASGKLVKDLDTMRRVLNRSVIMAR